ncbi:PH domain-containing protein [Arcanobacterium phocae]|uniref:PH domain-containing protein n=1 Tax=Arcanobacterium phocae TaxID=131112 RepID=UPI001C1044B4
MRKFKNSRYLMLERFITALMSAWIIVPALIAMYKMLYIAHPVPVWAVSTYYVWTRIYLIFFDFFSMTYLVDRRGITVVRRGLGIQKHRLRWKDISSIEVESGKFFRLVGRMSVRLMPLNTYNAPINILAVSQSEYAFIRESVRASRGVGGEREGRMDKRFSESASSVALVVPSLTKIEAVLYSLSRLSFLTSVPAIFSYFTVYYLGLDDNLSYANRMGILFSEDAVAIISSIVVIIFVAIYLYAIVMWMRFGNARTQISSDEITYEGGVIEKRSSVILFKNVEMIVLKQNFFMRIMGRASLSIAGASASEFNKTMVIAPFATVSDCSAIVSALIGQKVDIDAHVSRFRLFVVLVCLALIGVSAYFDLFFFAAIFGLLTFVLAICSSLYLDRSLEDDLEFSVLTRSLAGVALRLIKKSDPHPFGRFEIRLWKDISFYWVGSPSVLFNRLLVVKPSNSSSVFSRFINSGNISFSYAYNPRPSRNS